MRIVISDYHVGCHKWQQAILEELGHTVDIMSFAGSRYEFRQTPPLFISMDSFQKSNITNITPITNDEDIQAISQRYDTALISFPPSFYTFFRNIPFKFPLLVNIGHRVHIHTPNPLQFIEALKKDISDNIVNATAMSTYDKEYVKHYLGLDLPELPVTCFYLPRDKSYSPNRPEILIGPAHANMSNIKHITSIEDMNKVGSQFGLQFACIKSLYSHYIFEDLLQHRAVVLFPYSAFSISMVELYELGIPMFAPSKRLMSESALMQDAALYPFYMSSSKMNEVDIPHKDTPHPYSPNLYNKDDMMYWQAFTFFNTRKHIIYWDSVDDLCNKLTTTDLQKVSNDMQEETARFRREQLENWSSMLASLVPR
jgi:hypothetical protein